MIIKKDRLYALDAARGVAALGVAFFVHMRYLTGDGTTRHPELAPLGALPGVGWLYCHGDGLVDLFFVLSGFVFCHIYRTDRHPITASVGTYAVNRLARLCPLNFLTMLAAGLLLVCSTALYGSTYGGFIATPFELMLHVLMLKSGPVVLSFNAAAWSLSVECLCYLLFYILGRQRQSLFLGGCIGLVLIGAALQQNWLVLPLANWWFARGFVGFFAGCLLFTGLPIVRRMPFWLLVAAFIVGIAASVTNPPVLYHVGHFTRLSLFAWVPLVATLLRPGVQKLANNGLAKFLGDHSFSIYLLHIPIAMTILLLHGQRPFAMGEWGGVMTLDIVITLAAAAASFRYIERPCQNWLRSQHTSWRERRAAPSAW